MINEMNDVQRKDVGNFLLTQAERYNQQIHATAKGGGA
jgi:hypothetical protein